jgi:hypothetical protein
MDCKGVSSDDIKWSLDNRRDVTWGNMLLLALGISAVILAISTVLIVSFSSRWEEHGLLEGDTHPTEFKQDISIRETGSES